MATKPITVHAAKTHLSRLIDDACAGKEVIIAKGKIPLVRLVPLSSTAARTFGSMRGQISVDAAFFEALPEDELALWEGDFKHR